MFRALILGHEIEPIDRQHSAERVSIQRMPVSFRSYPLPSEGLQPVRQTIRQDYLCIGRPLSNCPRDHRAIRDTIGQSRVVPAMRPVSVNSSVMPSRAPDPRAVSSAVAPGRVWKAASLAVVCAAVVCAVLLLLFSHGEPGVILIGLSLVALGAIVVLLAQSIYLTQSAVRSAGGALEKRTRELDAVFESALDSILILDGEGICRHANPAALQLLGVRPDQIPGQPIALFCVNPGEAPIGNTAAVTGRDHGQMRMVRSSGEILTVEYAVSGNFVPDRHLFVFRDITERRRAEEAKNRSLEMARSALRESHALRRATLALARELRLNPVLDTLLQTLHALVPYSAAQIFLVESGTRLFLARESRDGALEDRAPESIETLDASGYPVLWAALRNPKGTLLADTIWSKDWRDLPVGVPARSWAGVPLRSADKVIGFLAVAHTLPGQFLPEHLRITESLAVSAAVAIQNARLYERAEIYAAELEGRLSDLRSARQALEQSEADRRTSAESFRKVFQFAPVALSVTSLDNGRFIEVNEAFERRFGYTREELIGKTSTELGFWQSSAERAQLAARLRQGKPVHAALTRFRIRSGDLRGFLYSAETIHLDGEPCILLACDHPPEGLNPEQNN
jgi:PAS domain S-box-containing protein